MIARVTTFSGPPEAHEQGWRIFEEQIVPWLEDAMGFRGALALLSGERALGITFWDSQETAAVVDEALVRFREEVAGAIGTTSLTLETYDVALAVGLALGPGS